MLSKKLLILTLVIAFSVHCPNGRAQENRLPLRFAQAVGKALINAPKSFIEVLSIKRVYVTGVETILLPLFPLRDGLPDEQESEAIESWELKVHSRAASDDSAYSEDSDSEGSSTSDGSSDNRSNEDEDNTESDVQYETTTLNSFRVANEVSQHCTTLELKKIKQEPVSDSEIHTNSTSDIDNRSNEDESDLRYATTTLNPFRVSNEISQYGATLELKKIKEVPVSDSKILTESEVDVTKVDAVKHRCDHEGCDYRTKRSGDLKRHKQIHLPADQRPKKPKMHHCDHEGCNYSTGNKGHLKIHKQIHLPANQRPKKPKIYQCEHEDCDYSASRAENLKWHKQTHLPADQKLGAHQCDHGGCNYRTRYSTHLKIHKQTHLPADQRSKRLKEHQCDHERCNYRTDQVSNLNRHKQTHLPADQRANRHRCDHQGCNYSTHQTSDLKRHKQTHLPADQRLKKLKVQQCDHEGCNYSTGQASNLKRHKQTHLPADQRPKRKACDQPPSNAKRKKGDKE
ncbi:C2H2-type zinc finger protein [Endozoicomonas sp. 4G]|uniref:C2H2-type zinc finger protein n=1 Tax=Endozoicomonas sp. 4G TaxID=2872754 RepID=UPI002078DABE|nr:C2H2-type zinc finger protein [Endozoicomonas sp. 4G]